MAEKFIAVTIGIGQACADLAVLAAESCRQRTGLTTYILEEEVLPKYPHLPSPTWLKCILFREFPEADTILYFDPDALFLKDWDPREFAGGNDFIAMPDADETAEAQGTLIGLNPDEYVNTGVFIARREPHEALFSRAIELAHTLDAPNDHHEQNCINLARAQLKIPLRVLDQRFNWLSYERDPFALGKATIGRIEASVTETDDGNYTAATKTQLEHLLHSHALSYTPTITLDAENASLVADHFLEHAPKYDPEQFSGRGITICGGGIKYFTCAWVCIHMLRKLGCQLPIEDWHLGEGEMDDKMREMLAGVGAEAVDGLAVRRRHPVRKLGGWELKPYSIILSKFREVLALDADNVPVLNPEYLFDTPEFAKTGAIFWPDYWSLAPDRSIWNICGVQYRDEPEFESGQILVDKERCWQELQLTMHYNENSDFYYQHIHGDKETFHMAWHRLEKPYAMPKRGVETLSDLVMCQHDFDGQRVFQHRNLAKWSLGGENPTIHDFIHESECLEALRILRGKGLGQK